MSIRKDDARQNGAVPQQPRWLSDDERATWVRLIAVTELLPGLLDSQLRRDAQLTHFEYFVLAMLSEAPKRRLRMTEVARLTSATLPRLSHVVRRLEDRGLVIREPCADDKRATNAILTPAGLSTIRKAAPGHVDTVRRTIFDAITPQQVDQLRSIADALLVTLDPDGRMTPLYDPVHPQPEEAPEPRE